MLTESQRKVFDFIDDHIERTGYNLININLKSDDESVFTYTVGLSLIGLPELVFVRRPLEAVQHVVSNLVAMRRADWKFTGSGQKIQGIFEHDLCLIEAQSAVQNEIMKVGVDYVKYRNDGAIDLDSTCIVCWPDSMGRFPVDNNYDKSIKSNVIPFKKPLRH